MQFDGASSFVQVPNNASLNAYPFTVTAWFRTSSISNLVQGIVDKYIDGSGNGWFLVVQNGRLRGYFSKSLGVLAVDATSTTVVSDGFWHHAALTVDGNGGKVYLDGVLIGSSAWTGGTPGAPTSSNPMFIGKYPALNYFLQGQVDEVTVWNRSLGAAELNYVKHRQLNGNEDGVVGLWHLDEGSGTTLNDATGHIAAGALVNNPIWVPSTAPIVFNQIAVDGVKFNGSGDYVSVPHDPNLNAFPLTLMAWVRTSYSNSVAGGIISKYVDASDNGYSMFVYNGHVRAWYFRDGANFVWDHGLGLDGGVIADGQWHHLALVVDNNGGRLYVDGNQTATNTWTGSSGPTSSTNQLQIGKYSTIVTSLPGVVDEVSVWNVALTPAQLAVYKNTALAGSENGLLAAWRFNEGSGTMAADLSPFARNAALVNNPAWTGSTAFLGDGTSSIQATLGPLQWTRQFAVKTIPAESGFTATAPFWVRRLDDFGAPGGNTSVQLNLPFALQSTLLGAPVLLASNSSAPFNLTLQPFAAASPQASAGGVLQSPTLTLQPQAGTQLASVSDTFQLGVSESYSINGGTALTGESKSLPSVQLMHFDGNLYFGPVLTTFSSIINNPVRGAPDNGGVDTQLAVNNQSGVIVGSPSHTYGFGGGINVVLQ
ncbi:MAG: Laminin sub domain 2, partial [Pedosphaera sp.]|nr:Laminin sub domain 2 [Pedosphaera sp.]